MAEATPFEILTENPLTDTTRRDRRSLLGVSVVSIAMVWTGLFPSQIATFGLSFQTGDRHVLMRLLGLVNAYLLVVFLAAALTDFVNWRHRFRAAAVRLVQDHSATKPGLLDIKIKQAMREVPLRLEADFEIQFSLLRDFQEANPPSFWHVASKIAPSATLKVVVLDLGLPLVVGLWAVCKLLPGLWIGAAVATGYLIGILWAYRTLRREITPRWQALAFALSSWFYLSWKRIQKGYARAKG